MVLSGSARSRLKVTANTNANLDCTVNSPVSNGSQFNVTWMHGTKTLVRMEPEGTVTLGPENTPDERLQLRRTGRLTFQLLIQQVKSTDSGSYRCLVEEWIQDPEGSLYKINTKSVTMELQVTENGKQTRL